MPKRFIVTYQSYRQSNKIQRLLARRALKRGREPEPVYRTGKQWND